MGAEIIIFASVFFLVGFVAYMYFNTRHKERMALIESGRDAGLFNTHSDPQYMGALKWGLLFVCLGIGAAVGINLDISHESDGPLFTFPLLLGSGGLGLIIYYFIAKSQREEEEDRV